MVNDVPKLKMSGITKQFPGVLALKDVSIKVACGQITGLVGVNGAGKSTLMNILGGIYQPDRGTIFIDGKQVMFGSPKDAAKSGVSFIHQELLYFGSQSVAENIFISHLLPRKGLPFLVNKKAAKKETEKYLRMLNTDINPSSKMEDISVGERQIVEIARALALGSDIVIFDEPTSSLSLKEKENLFKVIAKLKQENKAIIYISHFLDEVMRICDDFVVLRNGRVHGAGQIKEVAKPEIIEMIIGKKLAHENKTERAVTEKAVLRVDNLSSGNLLKSISFHLNEGEILGIWGLMGSGRTELIRAILGLDPIDKGQTFVRKDDKLERIANRKLLQYCGYITENRHADGLFLTETLWKNISVTALNKYTSNYLKLLDSNQEKLAARRYIKKMNIAAPNTDIKVESLSGGNQQKVIFAKWLNKRPRILIMDEPTRGVDVGAKLEINNFIKEIANQGTSAIVITSEVEEMVGLSDRVLVLREGRMVANVKGDAINPQTLMEISLGEIRANG